MHSWLLEKVEVPLQLLSIRDESFTISKGTVAAQTEQGSNSILLPPLL